MTELVPEQTEEIIVAEPFDINTLDDISLAPDGRIIIDNEFLNNLDLRTILEENEVILPSESPERIIMLAKRDELAITIGIFADMGKKDQACLYLTKPSHMDKDEIPTFTITKIGPLRNGHNKYNHSELACGKIVEDPKLSNTFTKLMNIFVPWED